MKKAYISGAISGIPFDEVIAKFREAEEHLTNEGWQPVNPLHNGLPVESSWKQHMIKDIEMLMNCDAIFMLPCWSGSKGARIEKMIAQEMGMKVFGLNKLTQESKSAG